MWPLFFLLCFLSADFRASQSYVSGAAVLQLMHAGRLAGRRESLLGRDSFRLFQVQGTAFFAPR